MQLITDFNERIDRMEAELEVDRLGTATSLERKFQELEQDGDIDTELARLKKKKKRIES